MARVQHPPVPHGKVAVLLQAGAAENVLPAFPDGQGACFTAHEPVFCRSHPLDEQEHMASRRNQDIPRAEFLPRHGPGKGRKLPRGKGPVQAPAAGDEAGAVHPGGKAADGGIPLRLLFRRSHVSGGGWGASVGGVRLQPCGKLARGVKAAPFVRHARGTLSGAPPRAGMAAGSVRVRSVNADVVRVFSMADVPGGTLPDHGGVSPAGFKGFTAGDGGGGRQYLRHAGGAGPQADGKGEQRQGVGHGLHV